MIDRALTAGSPSVTFVAVGFRMVPPSLATNVLNQTVTPSYCAPWISIRCALPSFFSCAASANICAQVLGGFGTSAELYHSSWVLLLSGTATSLPCQIAVSRAGLRGQVSAAALVPRVPVPP